MPTLTRKEVEDIALLARLHLESDEVERMQEELGVILDHFTVIGATDTEGVPAMTHAVPVDMPLREDHIEPSLSVEDALRNAPKKHGDLIVVPAIIAASGAAE